ncbi:MAG TPA: lytic transglycosylase F, partial [Colwellia sp.]|nr:lytic transglycosylase F [Colwellia sp.]
LQQKKYYKSTKHGYARGEEPVQYVDNIRRYYDTLSWLDEKAKEQAIALQLAQEASDALLLLNKSLNKSVKDSTLDSNQTERIIKEEEVATETAQ